MNTVLHLIFIRLKRLDEKQIQQYQLGSVPLYSINLSIYKAARLISQYSISQWSKQSRHTLNSVLLKMAISIYSSMHNNIGFILNLLKFFFIFSMSHTISKVNEFYAWNSYRNLELIMDLLDDKSLSYFINYEA